MNKRQKEFLQFTIEEEKRILADLKKVYAKAEKDIDAKIAELLARKDEENLQSIIYQVDYQRALKRQIGAILDELNNKQFESISQYLTECYENGFIGTLYDLQGQGIPLIFPINQEEVVRAIVHETKLSKRLYTALGEDVDELKKRIRGELSRGISQAYTYEKIAKNIRNQTSIGFNKSMRIVRTEGHRITQEATFDAQHKAKAAGADIVKQWDSTLDTRTRDSHVAIDGEIRELDEKFSNGLRYPGDSTGAAAEVINCRCVLLQRARKALESGLKSTKYDGNKGQIIEVSDAKNYDSFKKRYLETVDKSQKIGYNVNASGAISGAYNDQNDPQGDKRAKHAQLYYDELRNSKQEYVVSSIARNAGIDEETVKKMYNHLLIEKYNLGGKVVAFDPDYDIAQSLQRLREGKNIQEHDKILIRHEATEYELMKRGLSYEEAHAKSNESYNYKAALDKWKETNK